MRQATAPVSIACVSGPLPAVDAELFIAPWFEDDRASSIPGLDEATGGEVARAIESKEFGAHPYDLFITPTTGRDWKARRVALIGAGRANEFTIDLGRRLATAAGLAAKQRRVARVAFLARADGPAKLDARQLAQATAEGLTLAEFNVGTYKTGDTPPGAAPTWTIVSSGAADGLDAAVARGRILGESSNLARGLANEPGNTLTPREFAARAAQIAREAGVHVDVLDEQQIAALGMGLLLGVARGSSEPPRLMVFRHDPPGARPVPFWGSSAKASRSIPAASRSSPPTAWNG